MIGNHLYLSFNLETIYEDASFAIEDRDKVGIVGVNGAGKTTLFKIILKEQPLDSGSVTLTGQKRIGYLPQEIVIDNNNITVFDYLMQGRPLQQLNEELTSLYEQVALASSKEQPKILKKIGKVQSLLEYYDVYRAENILLELIDKMGIDSTLLEMKLKDLSGGQKSKIAFTRLLYSNPEILLLDEPTNHLDAGTRDFIIQYLKNYKGMVLIISHDISFLNAIIDKILYIDKANHKMQIYRGNYDDYLKKHAKEQELKERLIFRQEKEVEKLRDIVLLYSNSSGKRKRMAQSREKMLEKKQQDMLSRDKVYKHVRMTIKPNREGSSIPLKVNNIHFHYPNQPEIIRDLSFVINNRERFLIIGENGVGKSTLLKLLVKKLVPETGTIWYGSKTDIAYYAQELELLDPDKTILQNVQKEEYSESELRTFLGSFLFSGDDVFKLVKVLSPGEKARIALCKVMLERANVLVLDEPTNHLDPDTQKIIGENFKNYAGTVIMVSHNPDFVESIGIDRMLILPEGKITNYSKETLAYYYHLNQ